MTNIFKSVVAAAAVTACCMGNQYPAKAIEKNQVSAAVAIYSAQCSIRLGWLSEPDAYLVMGSFVEKKGISSNWSRLRKDPEVLAFARRWEAKNDCRDIDAVWREKTGRSGARAAATYAL